MYTNNLILKNDCVEGSIVVKNVGSEARLLGFESQLQH